MKAHLKIAGLCLAFFSLISGAEPKDRTGFDWYTPSLIAIQDRGRVKPLDTFARESVQFITGKASWKKQPPVETIFGWLIAFDGEWEEEPFIRIAYQPVKEALKLDKERQHFSPKELRGNEDLQKAVREALQKQKKAETLSEIDNKVLEIQNQRGLLDAIVSGQAWNILPNPAGEHAAWFSLASLTDQSAGEALPAAGLEALRGQIGSAIGAFTEVSGQKWNPAVSALRRTLSQDLFPGHYPAERVLLQERVYNHLRPFRIAWELYLLAVIGLTIFLVSGKHAWQLGGLGVFIAAFLVHTGGFILRMLVAGRPPVTNMYESVIWVSWGCALFALIIGTSYKKAVIPAAASVFAVVALVLADTLPSVLDPSIQPLEPVLRSNFWLTIHVLTITLGYAAFALSLCLGNVVIGHYFFHPKETETIQYASLYMYRAIQIGVVLLAAGTILGGVWADYSWGRFWGWDPKEVWALIALLLYLAVLHGRFAGWLHGFGFAATAVVSFLGVLMAWYGVNFVLGAGLHSYGFGTGGTGYVGGYVAIQLLFILWAYRRYSSSGAKRAAIFPKR
ncbi:cytochrome c biogenesis protein CcsA [bacterium]|nr:cytochrome c biogenesis protein CcsA [bacterium]